MREDDRWNGVSWPAQWWQLIAHLDTIGADWRTRALVHALPARSFAGVADLLGALNAPPA